MSRYGNDTKELPKKEMNSFEQQEMVLKGKYCFLSEDLISSIFREELLNKIQIAREEIKPKQIEIKIK